MRDLIKFAKNSFILFTLLLTLAACNNDDDVQEIFIDRNWTLSFIQEGNEKSVPENVNYVIIFKSGTFNLTTPSNATISGNWQADGGTRTFKCSNIKTDGNINNDNIAKKMRNMLQNAISYGGDANWLQIIVQHGNAYMQFHNK